MAIHVGYAGKPAAIARSASSCGGWGRKGARSEARAQQRLAPGGRSPHNPDKVLARSPPPNPDELEADPYLLLGRLRFAPPLSAAVGQNLHPALHQRLAALDVRLLEPMAQFDAVDRIE